MSYVWGQNLLTPRYPLFAQMYFSCKLIGCQIKNSCRQHSHINCCMSKTTQPLALFCLWQCNGQISNPVQDWRTNAMSGVCTMYIPFVFEFNVFMRLWRAKPYFPENCFKNQQMSPWWYLRARFYNHRDFIISSIAIFTVRFCLRQFSS